MFWYMLGSQNDDNNISLAGIYSTSLLNHKKGVIKNITNTKTAPANTLMKILAQNILYSFYA